ncbi:hypothetical protein Q5P01_022615 [Channa striata]|uniref:Uncharacterized protein n=1 Tax=Channa striata TaxID=64152 RepID=A0AA88ISV8_CHASR|nr:hypothetical protein Q5P01_022615 [Channa striata]
MSRQEGLTLRASQQPLLQQLWTRGHGETDLCKSSQAGTPIVFPSRSRSTRSTDSLLGTLPATYGTQLAGRTTPPEPFY